MISRTNGTPMMEAITIMKTAGRLFSKIELTTVVVLTAVAPVLATGGGGDGPAAGTVEIFCKALVALVNPAVAFSKAFVAFPNVLLRVSVMAPVPLVLLVGPLVIVFVLDWLSLRASEGELASAARSEGKL